VSPACGPGEDTDRQHHASAPLSATIACMELERTDSPMNSEASEANREARRSFRRLKQMTHKRRVAYMKALPDDMRWRVARLAAGGTLDD
jgi:hypothetical protein